MARFNLCTIRPKGFLHASAFDEVKSSLAWALAALGHEPLLTENTFAASATNVIFGAELAGESFEFPPDSIIYNLEQPSHPRVGIVQRLAAAHRVWDFSASNIRELWSTHPCAIHVPIGYTPNLTRIPRAATQDIDVCFFGWRTPRRSVILQQLAAAGLNVHYSDVMYGGGRDNVISRSKVCLNVHHDGRDRMEIVRLSYLLANSKCVVTEESADDGDYEYLHGAISRARYDNLVHTIKTYINDSHQRCLMEESALDVFRRQDYVETVRRALAASDAQAERDHPMIAAPPTPAPTSSFPAFAKEQARTRAITEVVESRYRAACREGDMAPFASRLRSLAHGNVMEIGVRDGASTSAFLLGVADNGGHVYSVDVDSRCGTLFAGHPSWTFIGLNSTAYKKVNERIPFELDLLLIDGDHSRYGVMSDFIHYAPRVRRGGLILFHDINPTKRPDGCNDPSWPSDDVRHCYEQVIARTGWQHEEMLDHPGLGIITKGDEITEALVEG